MKELFAIICASLLFTTSISIESSAKSLAPQNNPQDSTFSKSTIHFNPLEYFSEFRNWYKHWNNLATMQEKEEEEITITTYDKDGNKDSTFNIKGYQIVSEGNATVVKIKK